MNKKNSITNFRPDPFLMGIVLAIMAGYFFPFEQSVLKKLPLDRMLAWGISMIFFFYGLKLSPQKLKASIQNWKLHSLIQLSTFILFPLLSLAFFPLIQNQQQELMWMGIFFFAALPSTVSSSVVMVSIAKGNIPAAIFNASISGLIGVFITPLLLNLAFNNKLGSFDLSGLYIQLAFEIISPVILGMVLQRWLGKYALRFSKQMALFDKSIITLIIYNSFSHSFATNLFEDMSWKDILLIIVVVLILFYIVFSLIETMSRWFKFNREDQITAQFCGTKKSLVHGTVFFNIMFQGSTSGGIMLIPLMVFHTLQIIVISYKSTQLSNEKYVKSKKSRIIIFPFR